MTGTCSGRVEIYRLVDRLAHRFVENVLHQGQQTFQFKGFLDDMDGFVAVWIT